jgi:hypothetical protein
MNIKEYLNSNWFPNGEDALRSGNARDFMSLLFTLAISTVLFDVFNIAGDSGLNIVWPILAGGAAINHFLPKKFQPTFQIGLSVFCIISALPLLTAIFILTTIAVIILIFIAVKSELLRLVLLLILMTFAALINLNILYIPSLRIALPILGAMLMFRLILYSYERKVATEPVPLSLQITYLFQPLNLVFYLFPILDYRTWTSQFRSCSDDELYEISLRRILLGTGQLITYRILYALQPPVTSITDNWSLIVYTVINYLLILQMIGSFHVIIGICGLFGYSLPPIFNNAFFISGFTSVWRKLNVYWKDFITRILYYRIYFKVRKKVKYPVFLTGLFMFTATWLLHNYQWFWIQGTIDFRATDLLYWIILGACISISLQLEILRPPYAPCQDLKSALIYSLRVTGMFLFMSFMWLFWESSSIGEFLYLLKHILINNYNSYKSVIIVVAFISVVFSGYWLFNKRLNNILNERKYALGIVLSGTALLFAIAFIGPHITVTGNTALSDIAKGNFISAADKINSEQGYYEQLTQRKGKTPWELPIQFGSRAEWFSGAEQPVADLRKRILKPNVKIVHGTKFFTTNAFGLRSPEIENQQSPGILRIAIVGGSYEMGSGVSDEEVYIRIAEKLINDSLKFIQQTFTVELINFSTGGYHIPQYLYVTEQVIPKFNPEVVIYFAHSNELTRFRSVLSGIVKHGIDPKYPFYESAFERGHVHQGQSRKEIDLKLAPQTESLMEQSYQFLKQQQTLHGYSAIWIGVPTLGHDKHDNEFATTRQLLKKNGFELYVLNSPYSSYSSGYLQISSEDNHPNAKGHLLLARELTGTLFPILLEIRKAEGFK